MFGQSFPIVWALENHTAVIALETRKFLIFGPQFLNGLDNNIQNQSQPFFDT